MVHVENSQGTEQLVFKSTIGVQVGIWILVLRDNRTDNGCYRQREQKEYGQLDRNEEFPQRVRAFQKQLLINWHRIRWISMTTG